MAIDDLTTRLNYPYLMGVYLAVNATADAFILVDGPNCVTYKAEHIHGKHDWSSTLLDCRGVHRIVLSGASRDTVSLAREDEIEQLLDGMAKREEGGVVILCALTMCGMISVDYQRVLKLVNERWSKTAFEVPTDTLVHDWLDGYDHLMKGYATHVPLRSRGVERRPDRVAVVGHMMHRNEGDCRGDTAELVRMLEGIGLEVASVWLDGGTWADLSRAESAGTVLSLPYGRTAARTLAERLDADVLEVGLPIGLEGTARWLRHIAGELGTRTLAERFIDRELRAAVPQLQWVIPESFLNRRAALVADPHLLTGLLEFSRELGLRPANALALGRDGHVTDALRAQAPPSFHVQAHEREWLSAMEATGEVDLVITNNLGWQVIGDAFGPVIEFGFPSYFTHALRERPVLGFRGAVQQAERMADTLLADRMRRGRRPPTFAPRAAASDAPAERIATGGGAGDDAMPAGVAASPRR